MNSTQPIKTSRLLGDDLEWVLSLANRSFTDPWTRGMLLSELNHPQSMAFKAEYASEPAGYMFLRAAYVGCELLSLAVEPTLRLRGIGMALVNEAARYAKMKGLERIMLETSHRNETALSFYRAAGFIVVGKRPNYYPEEQADAVLMDLLVE